MVSQIFLFVSFGVGLYLVLTGLFPRVNSRAEKAVHARGRNKITSTEQIVDYFTPKLLPHISLDITKRQQLQQTLTNLQKPETPEMLHARAWITGAIYFVGIILLLPLFQFLIYLLELGIPSNTFYTIGFVLATFSLFTFRGTIFKNLEKQVKEKRTAIEWELPQFSGTIAQQLVQNKNMSVIRILESYQKISGKYLSGEIEKTLSDMRVGDIEKALKGLSNRVNSGSLTQITQGLIALSRGDNQYQYFQMITHNFETQQKQLIQQELLNRPKKLNSNNFLLLAGMIAMFGVAIGGYLINIGGVFF